MRLTAELIQGSHSYLNPLKERELDLRGHRIPQIENLGVAGPQDSIDLTDNDLQIIGNFPLSPRIQTLLLARNRISSIQQSLPNSIPSLTNLVLASNQLSELADLDVLGRFPRLTHLVLLDNPVTKNENFRYWVIWRCSALRFLDYKKVKLAEREMGKKLFGTLEKPTMLASSIMGKKTKAFDVTATNGTAAGGSKFSRIKLSATEKKRFQEMIAKASSLEEIIALETAVNEGRIPPGLKMDDAMEE